MGKWWDQQQNDVVLCGVASLRKRLSFGFSLLTKAEPQVGGASKIKRVYSEKKTRTHSLDGRARRRKRSLNERTCVLVSGFIIVQALRTSYMI